MIGRRFGPYEITAKLGEGGMGEVWRATDSTLQRDVAVKVLPAAFSADSERLARFSREARLLAQLQHPNIATIYGFEEGANGGSGTPALIMELVEGPTLADRIARGALPLDEALGIARQIAEALEAAHDKGIVHRDLKPRNVKLTADDVDSGSTVKVLDFGLAKAVTPVDTSSPAVSSAPTLTAAATEPEVILGTAPYMAPEQARGTAVDKRADIWAFGVVLFEMLTGRRLFGGDSATEVLASVLRSEIDFDQLPAGTPPAARRLLRRCMERNPKNRLHDIADARLMLDDLRTGPADVTADERASVRSRRLLVAAALVAWTLGTLAVVSWLGPGEPAPPSTSVRAKIPIPPPLMWSDLLDRPLALSPDGSQLAVTLREAEGQSTLYLRALDDLEFRKLAGTEGAAYPFWSPDGSAIAFFADGKLRRIDLASGVVRTLCAAAEARGGAWSSLGTIVFSPIALGPLSEVSADGGTPTAITTVTSDAEGHRHPHFLPDGRSFLFLSWKQEETAIYGFSAVRGEIQKILDSPAEAQYVEPGYLAFVAEGNLMLQPFDADSLELSGSPRPVASGVSHSWSRKWIGVGLAANGPLVYLENLQSPPVTLLWIDTEGRETMAWSEPFDEDLDAGQVSPDGRRGVFLWRAGSGSPRTLVLDFEAGTKTRVGPPNLEMSAPRWSGDGERLVFGYFGGSGYELGWMPPRADEVPRPLTFGGKANWYLAGAVTPDGRSVLFARKPPDTQNLDLFLVDIEGHDAPSEFLAGPSREDTPRLSPNAEWVAFASDLSGPIEVWVTDFPDARDRRQVSIGLDGNWGWFGPDEIWWNGADGVQVSKLSRLGVEVEVEHRLLITDNHAVAELRFVDYSMARGRFLAYRLAEEPRSSDLVVVSDWRSMVLDPNERP